VGAHAPSGHKSLGLVGDELKQKSLGRESTHHEHKGKSSQKSQSPQTQRTNSPGRENKEARREDAMNIITQSRVNKSRYAWDEENYKDEEKEMGALYFTRRVHRTRYPKDSKYHMTSKNMMGRKNPSCGYQIIFRKYKYSEDQVQQQCKACSYTSPVQHSLG
jgi:predicted RNA-binding Zn-ribbon protein involved in translation (DUF1610 family)